MRILIINELAVMGGAEVQTFREWEYFAKKGHDVYVLTFDDNKPKMLEGKELNYPIKWTNIRKFVMRVFGNKRIECEIKKIICGISPDVVHLNNAFRSYKVIFKSINDIPTIQTIRDYSAVCPQKTCVLANGIMCEGYLHYDCRKCIGFSLRSNFLFFTTKQYNKARKKCINKFLSPSEALAKACCKNDIPAECLNNPFDFTKITGKAKNFGRTKIYLYYGHIAEHKGVEKLFEAFDKFYADQDVELWLAGIIVPEFKNRFEQLIKSPYAKYMGVLSYQEIMEMYSSIYCVVVPSLWIENYPNTVLEAIANKTLVIGSNRGGIPEMICDERFCFDVLDQKSILGCLVRSSELPQTEYDRVTETAYKRILENNSQEKYYMKLMKIYEDLLQQK